jgi:hypothetical protein
MHHGIAHERHTMTEPNPILDNYRGLHESTGESFESIAARLEAAGDPATAALIRSEFKPAAPEPKRGAPSGKRTAVND